MLVLSQVFDRLVEVNGKVGSKLVPLAKFSRQKGVEKLLKPRRSDGFHASEELCELISQCKARQEANGIRAWPGCGKRLYGAQVPETQGEEGDFDQGARPRNWVISSGVRQGRSLASR